MVNFRLTIVAGLLFTSGNAPGLEVSQFIFEDINKIKCTVATEQEAESVRCGLKSPFKKVQADVDEIIESMVFKKLGESKASETRCSQKILEQVVSNPEIRDRLAEQTCQQISPLVQYWKSINSIQREIESYQTINDRSLRRIEDAEFRRNAAVIKELKDFKKSFENQAEDIVKMDTLLTSPRVLSRIKTLSESSSFSKAKSDQEICIKFKSELPNLLSEELTAIKNKASALEEFAASPSGFSKILIKRHLWNDGGREQMMSLIGKDPNVLRSTMCRMEGRYGKGFEQMSHLSMIGSLGIGGVTFFSGKLVSSAVVQSIGAARVGLGALVIAEFGIGTVLSIRHAVQSCVSDKANSQIGKFCGQMSPEELKSLLLERANDQMCTRAVTLSAFSTILGGLGARSVLKTNGRPGVVGEIESRILETRAVNLAKSLEASPGEIASLLKGFPPKQQQQIVDALELAYKQAGADKVRKWMKVASKRNNCK